MTILNHFLITNIIFLLSSRMKGNKLLSLLINIPFFIYFFNSYSLEQNNFLLIGVFLYQLILLFFSYKDLNISINYYAIPWLGLLINNSQTIIDIFAGLLVIQMVTFTGEKVFKNANKIEGLYKTRELISLFALILVFIMFILTKSSYQEIDRLQFLSFDIMQTSLILLISLFLCSVFGSFTYLNKKFENNNVHILSKYIYHVLIPMIVVAKVFSYIDMEIIHKNILIVMIPLISVIILTFFDLLKSAFVATTSSLISYNVFTALLVKLLVPETANSILMVFFIINLMLYFVLKSNFKNKHILMLYTALPLSILYFMEKLIENIGRGFLEGLLVLILILFSILLAFNHKRISMVEDEI